MKTHTGDRLTPASCNLRYAHEPAGTSDAEADAMITFTEGNLPEARAEALVDTVNAVNTVGVMGS